MAAVQVQRVVVAVVAVGNLDATDAQAVAGQIVLHPATAVLECDVLDGDVATLDEAQQMGTGDALVVPRQFGEHAASPVDGAIAVDDDILHRVGIDELDGLGMGAQRHVVRFHAAVVPQVGGAIECCSQLQMQVDIALQDDGANLVVAGRHHHGVQALGTTDSRIVLRTPRHQVATKGSTKEG